MGFRPGCFPWAGFVPTRLGIAGFLTPSTNEGDHSPAIGAIRSGQGTGIFHMR